MEIYRQPFKNEWPITQNYGETITSAFHTGIDYACPIGTSILASDSGKVVFAAWDKTGYGNLVIVQHSSGVSTLYAHLSNVSVFSGENVRQGELLGHSGNTGNSTGPHLHFEARYKWNDYKTHFNPMLLPLVSFDDSISNSPSKSDPISISDSSLLKPGDVIVVAPAGAFGHNSDFSNKVVFPYGTKLVFTGQTKNYRNLKFCKCEIWIASDDGTTQILKNTK